MKRFIAILLLAACTQQKTTNVVAPPADISGAYSVAWSSPAGLNGVANLVGDTIAFDIYPCRPVGAPDSIGGTFEYTAPDFSATIKSIDGTTRVFVQGAFAGTAMHGSFEVRVLGVLCTNGDVVMERQ